MYVYVGSYALQPTDPGSLPAIAETRQAEEDGSHGLYAKVSDYLESHAA